MLLFNWHRTWGWPHSMCDRASLQRLKFVCSVPKDLCHSEWTSPLREGCYFAGVFFYVVASCTLRGWGRPDARGRVGTTHVRFLLTSPSTQYEPPCDALSRWKSWGSFSWAIHWRALAQCPFWTRAPSSFRPWCSTSPPMIRNGEGTPLGTPPDIVLCQRDRKR